MKNEKNINAINGYLFLLIIIVILGGSLLMFFQTNSAYWLFLIPLGLILLRGLILVNPNSS